MLRLTLGCLDDGFLSTSAVARRATHAGRKHASYAQGLVANLRGWTAKSRTLFTDSYRITAYSETTYLDLSGLPVEMPVCKRARSPSPLRGNTLAHSSTY